jgi:hypothetical protein
MTFLERGLRPCQSSFCPETGALEQPFSGSSTSAIAPGSAVVGLGPVGVQRGLGQEGNTARDTRATGAADCVCGRRAVVEVYFASGQTLGECWSCSKARVLVHEARLQPPRGVPDYVPSSDAQPARVGVAP